MGLERIENKGEVDQRRKARGEKRMRGTNEGKHARIVYRYSTTDKSNLGPQYQKERERVREERGPRIGALRLALALALAGGGGPESE